MIIILCGLILVGNGFPLWSVPDQLPLNPLPMPPVSTFYPLYRLKDRAAPPKAGQSQSKKDEDKLIAYSILNIINNIDEIENLKKKEIYILLREMTNSPTAKLTKVINILKSKYGKLKQNFDNKGSVFK